MKNISGQAGPEAVHAYRSQKLHGMQLRIFLILLMVSAAIAGLSWLADRKHGSASVAVANADSGFAVVELFTSEGCSSCPPADEAMIHLSKEFKENVYFLGFHVDYWDYIGWKDAFDNPEYSRRQNKYAERFGLSSIYTPQAIVNGKKELVGSREGELKGLIQEELLQPGGKHIELEASASDGTIRVRYHVPGISKAVLNIALVQLMASSQVKRGENSGRKLEHINVVRSLQTVQLNGENEGKASFGLQDGLTSSEVKIIAFVQDNKSLKILGASAARP